MKADLHMHSTNSDGHKTTFELVDLAKSNGIDIIAITDHDMVGHVEETIQYGLEQGVRVLPAIELSTLEQNKPVHVLGYFRDGSYQSEELKKYFVEIKEKRENRARKIVENLKKYNDIHITYERIAYFAKGIIARPHIAKAIIEAYPEYSHDEVFEKFIGEDCKAYIPSVEMPVLDGIDLLRRHNCVIVLAHPVLLKKHIKDTVLSYDFDGFEAKYYQNKPGDEAFYTSLAKSRNMIITGGSDYHGIPHDTKHGEVGEIYLEGPDLDNFLSLLQG